MWDRRGDADRGRHRRRRQVRALFLAVPHARAAAGAFAGRRRGAADAARDRQAREQFYDDRWDTWRWRLLFRLFFSRFVMGRLGRDPEFFRYVEGDVSGRILARTRHALTALDPTDNPYVHWILTGTHGAQLPVALRAEHFDTIRARLDRLEWHCQALEEFVEQAGAGTVDRFNLSDLFEYMSVPSTITGCSSAWCTPAVRMRAWLTGTCSRRAGGRATMSAVLTSLDDACRSGCIRPIARSSTAPSSSRRSRDRCPRRACGTAVGRHRRLPRRLSRAGSAR